MTDEGQVTPEYSFDISKMETTTELASLHQEGNFLVGITEKGVSFRQRIPVGKVLNKDEGGNWVLRNVEVV